MTEVCRAIIIYLFNKWACYYRRSSNDILESVLFKFVKTWSVIYVLISRNDIAQLFRRPNIASNRFNRNLSRSQTKTDAMLLRPSRSFKHDLPTLLVRLIFAKNALRMFWVCWKLVVDHYDLKDLRSPYYDLTLTTTISIRFPKFSIISEVLLESWSLCDGVIKHKVQNVHRYPVKIFSPTRHCSPNFFYRNSSTK